MLKTTIIVRTAQQGEFDSVPVAHPHLNPPFLAVFRALKPFHISKQFHPCSIEHVMDHVDFFRLFLTQSL